MQKIMIGIMLAVCLAAGETVAAGSQNAEYEYWKALGQRTGTQALALMTEHNVNPRKENLIALTDAGRPLQRIQAGRDA